jgi:hypothetical protein
LANDHSRDRKVTTPVLAEKALSCLDAGQVLAKKKLLQLIKFCLALLHSWD